MRLMCAILRLTWSLSIQSPTSQPSWRRLLPLVRRIHIQRQSTAEQRIGRALGFPDTPEGLPSSVVHRIIEGQRVLHIKPDNNHVSSMLLDLRQGKPIEVEVIVGEVVRMAKARNVPVPVSVLTDAMLCSAFIQRFV